MKSSGRGVLRLIECVGLGLWIALTPLALAGGLYEIVTGYPSDGFLFSLSLFVVPWSVAVMCVVPVSCWNGEDFLFRSRQVAIVLLGGMVLIWCL